VITIEFVQGGIERLNDVGPLWTRLIAHHAAKTSHFRQRVSAYTFEARRAGLLAKTRALDWMDARGDEEDHWSGGKDITRF